MNNHARIDAFVASLRAQAAQAQAAQKKKDAEALIAEQYPRSAAGGSSSRKPQNTTAMPKFSLASQEAFLQYAGFNKPAPAKSTASIKATQEPSQLSSPSVTSREDREAPVGPVKVRLPQPPQITGHANLQSRQNLQRNAAEEKSAVIHNILAKESQPHTVQNGDVGLAGSRWASTGPVALRTPSVTAAPPSPVLQPNTLTTKGRTVLRENNVKVTRGRGEVTRGTVRLVKNDPQKDKYFTIELEVDDKPVLKQQILDDDTFTCESTVITYRARKVEDGSAPAPTTTWSIKFQMPYQAWSFYNPVASNPNARNRHKQPDTNTATQPNTDPAAVAPNQPPIPIEQSNALRASNLNRGSIQVPKAREYSSLNIPEHPSAINASFQPGSASQQSISAVGCDARSTAASAGSGAMSLSNTSLIQEDAVAPSSSQRNTSSEWPLIQPTADYSSAGLLDRYQPGGSHRISSQAWSEMTEVAGFEPLVSLSHDEPESDPMHSWLQALLNMDDTKFIQSTFEYFEKKPEGPFLHQLSTIVAKENIPPTSRLTGQEILSSHKYQEAAECLVGGHLCNSETFAMMPDVITIHYTTEKARKVLKKAVAHREGQNMTEHDVAPQPSPDFKQPDSGLSISQHSSKPVMVQELEQPQTTNTVGDSKGDASRITYFPAYLLNLRQNASRFRSELVSGEVVDYVVRQQSEVKPINPANILSSQQVQLRPLNPANIIGTTRNGLPIVAGRDQLPRQSARGNAGGPDFKPTTSVGAWQAYSVAESGDPSEPSHTAPTTSEHPNYSLTPTPAQKSSVQKTPSSNGPGSPTSVKIEPVMSPPKPANTAQIQETDMALWGALLTIVRGNKQDPCRIRALSSPKPQTPLASSRGSRHIPTNSECDRLAKTFEGLDLSKELKEELATSKTQPVAASDAHVDAVEPLSKDQAPSTSSLAMYEKIKESLKSPLLSSSRPKSTASITPVQSVANTVKSDTGSLPPTPTLAIVKAVPTQEVKAENPTAVPMSPIVQTTAVPSSVPAKSFHPEPAVKIENSQIDFPSAHPPFPAKAGPAPATAEVEPKNGIKTEFERTQATVSITAQPTTPIPKTKTPKSPDVVAPAPRVPEKALPFLENVTNKDLKGVPGLKASKWASEPVAQAPAPRARPTPMTTATPIIPIYPQYSYPYAPQQPFGDVFASPPPVHATITAPALQTILIPDPLRPGLYTEVTGIPRDQVAPFGMQPMPPTMMTPPRKQENVPYSQHPLPVSSFGPRAEMSNGHKSPESSGSDVNFNTGNTPFTPSRGRGASVISPQHRTALSPVRQGENVQAKLQSRLNTSLAGRSPNGHA
jgi:hypothetical protein